MTNPDESLHNLRRRNTTSARQGRLVLALAFALAGTGILTATVHAQQVRRHVLVLSNNIPRRLGTVTFHVAAYSNALGKHEIAPGQNRTFTVSQTHFNTIFYIHAFKDGKPITARRCSTNASGSVSVTLEAGPGPGGRPRYWMTNR